MTDLGIKPLRDKILIKPVKPTAVSEGGIIIPDVFQETQKRGTVVAVGDGRRAPNGVLVKPEVKVGDFLIHSGEGFEIIKDGVSYYLISSEQVTAVEKKFSHESKSQI